MGPSDQDETLLVLLTQQCDVAAFEELLRRLHRPLRQYVELGGRDSNPDKQIQRLKSLLILSS